MIQFIRSAIAKFQEKQHKGSFVDKFEAGLAEGYYINLLTYVNEDMMF